MFNDIKKVLVLAPHTDDGELGCGGSISRLISLKKDVFYIAFSACEDSIPEGFSSDALNHEVKRATEVLGIPNSNLIIKNYRVRYFPAERQNILEDMIILRKEISPDLIFMPSANAMHQDHRTIAEEGLRAFKRFSCLGYDLPWDIMNFHFTCFIELTRKDVNKKISALKEYKTQFARPYVKPEFLEGLARVRGAQINKNYAEAFEVLRLII